MSNNVPPYPVPDGPVQLVYPSCSDPYNSISNANKKHIDFIFIGLDIFEEGS